ncbi:amidase [Aspergillus parasiticus]|uniref:amidase n=1 Tax=Aspergillus parasiticus TaxID=5067 RepID=A0A5N6DVH2_ASPPA|nr:amidase [Aspergillus parasiticus]
MASSWSEKIQKKREARHEAIPTTWRIPAEVLAVLKTPIEGHQNNIIELDLVRKSGDLNSHELDIIEKFTVEQLLCALVSGALTAVEVTVAYSKRAAVAQQLLAGPFHGLSIGLKDSLQVAGSQAALGFVSYLDHMSERNSHLVDVLLSLGAIVYVETNVPQTLATVDSDNNIFGRTVNPWNTMLGAGGSSGGEGALVALYGSPLGVGADVGGSIRIPSLCCGTYGFKPTVSRVPYGGQKDCTEPGMNFMLPSAGLLSHDINSLDIFMRLVINAEPARFDSSVIDTQLRIDVLPEDPRFPLHPTVKHTMNEAVRRLRAQCHTIIPLNVQKCYIADATETAWEFFMINDAAYKHVAAGEEPLVPSVICTHEIARNLEYRFIPDVNDRDRLSQLAVFRTMRALIIDEWRKIWVDHKLDLVLAPSAQSTAVKHDKVGLPAYTTLTNVLDVRRKY